MENRKISGYQTPIIEVIKLSSEDIVTTSGDSNGTEWDPMPTIY